jgi:3-hydroxyacyl-CoA dehydrogenase
MFSFDNLPDMTTVNARALEHVRAMVAWKRQDNRGADKSGDAQGIRSVGIVGAGTMGAEIAAAHLKFRLPVTILDNDPAALATVAQRTAAEMAAGSDAGDSRALVDQLLRPTGDLAHVANCDLIIETILEALPAKRELFKRLHDLIGPDALVTSNTSTIAIGKLAEGMAWAERFCGLHFCHPVRERPLVEIVRGAKTDEETIVALAAHAKRIDKLPVVVADSPGFVVNRLLLPYLTEALELLMEGTPIDTIEDAALKFGMAMGPFRLMDEIGLDTTLQAGWCMAAVFGERMTISPLLVALVKRGRLGQKTGAGFFAYGEAETPEGTGSATGTGSAKGTVPFLPTVASRRCPKNWDSPQAENRGSPQVDAATIEIVARWVKTANRQSAEDIAIRLVMPMVLEATRIMEECGTRDPRDIDLAVIFGLGFPARRGGLLWWADTMRPSALVEMIGRLEAIGPRWKPTRLLSDMAAQGTRFYG